VFFQANPDSGAGEFSVSCTSRENFFFSFLKAGAEDAEVSDSEISLTLILSCPLEC
jgi:hypothetical protein